MRKDTELILGLATLSLALHSCSPFEPKSVKAAPLNPTPIPTQPQPTEDPPKSVTTSVPVEAPAQMPIEISPTPTEIQPFLYFSQNGFGNDTAGDKKREQNRPKLTDMGCSFAVGGMVTRTNPQIYLQDFNNYFESIGKYGPARVSKNGSDINDNMDVLRSLGFQPIELSVEGATPDEVTARIEYYTSKGIAVWVNTRIINWRKYHNSMSVGVYDGGKIFNDPLYGESIKIPDSKIDEENWKVYAIIPPGQ